jgi:hypothetical protein
MAGSPQPGRRVRGRGKEVKANRINLTPSGHCEEDHQGLGSSFNLHDPKEERMNLRQNSKLMFCVCVLGLTIAMPALWGCHSAMLGDNTRIGTASWLGGQTGFMPFAEEMHGALQDGVEELVIYSCREDGAHELVVWDPDTSTAIEVYGNEAAAAAVVKEHYLTVEPGHDLKPGDAVTFEYQSGDTLNPELHIEVFTDPQAPGALHVYKLLGEDSNGHDSVYITGSNLIDLADNLGGGRTVTVREADGNDTTSPEVIAMDGLTTDESDSTVTVGLKDYLSITTDEPLGLFYAIAWGDSASDSNCSALADNDCFDTALPVIFNVAYVDLDNGEYTYYMVQVPNHTVILEGSTYLTFNELKYDTHYVLTILQEVTNDSSNWNTIFPSKTAKGSQDLSGNILEDSDNLFGDYVELADLIGGSDTFVNVSPYFFTTESAP